MGELMAPQSVLVSLKRYYLRLNYGNGDSNEAKADALTTALYISKSVRNLNHKSGKTWFDIFLLLSHIWTVWDNELKQFDCALMSSWQWFIQNDIFLIFFVLQECDDGYNYFEDEVKDMVNVVYTLGSVYDIQIITQLLI